VLAPQAPGTAPSLPVIITAYLTDPTPYTSVAIPPGTVKNVVAPMSCINGYDWAWRTTN